VLLVGLLYFGWCFGAAGFARAAGEAPSEGPRALVETIGVALLLLNALWTWAFPSTNALTFTMPEVQLLFPAPIARAALIRMKIASVQLGLAFSSLMMGFVTRNMPALKGWAVCLGAWLIFNLMHMNRLAASLVAVEKPAPLRYRIALPPVLGLLLLLYFFIVRADVAFEEAAVAASEALARRREEFLRTGRFTAPATRPLRPAPIALGPVGHPIAALVWKNLLMATRFPVRRAVLIALGFLGAALIAANVPGWGPYCAVVAVFPGTFAGVSLFMGPDFARYDLRASLRSPDLLKALPLPGWQVFLGEVLAPALLLALGQVFLISLTALLLSGEALRGSQFAEAPVVPLVLGGLLALLPLDLFNLTIANGAAVCFPGWVPLGPQATRGSEAMGVMILVNIARFFLLAIGLGVPGLGAVLAGAILFPWIGPWAVPIACALGGAGVLAEVALMVRFLGERLERLDPSRDLA
ncbi:hypothetical protein HY251_10845, partial [bacterium]|nr:hypothetical protein [bacterium]